MSGLWTEVSEVMWTRDDGFSVGLIHKSSNGTAWAASNKEGDPLTAEGPSREGDPLLWPNASAAMEMIDQAYPPKEVTVLVGEEFVDEVTVEEIIPDTQTPMSVILATLVLIEYCNSIGKSQGTFDFTNPEVDETLQGWELIIRKKP